MRRSLLLASVICMVSLAGCASVPPEAAALSSLLGERIDEFERSQVAMLHQLMDQRREQVDEFMSRDWIPQYSERLMQDPALERLLQIAGDDTQDSADRLRALAMLGTNVQRGINEKRTSMITAVDELERDLERRLRGEYAMAAQMNAAVTSFLLSASEVADARNRYLQRFGIREGDVGQAIDEAESASARLRDGAATIDQRAEQFLDQIKKIRERFQ